MNKYDIHVLSQFIATVIQINKSNKAAYMLYVNGAVCY